MEETKYIICMFQGCWLSSINLLIIFKALYNKSFFSSDFIDTYWKTFKLYPCNRNERAQFYNVKVLHRQDFSSKVFVWKNVLIVTKLVFKNHRMFEVWRHIKAFNSLFIFARSQLKLCASKQTKNPFVDFTINLFINH